MKIKFIIIVFLSTSTLCLGQFNIQTGYDFGLIQLEKITSYNTEDTYKWNSLKRLNLNFEYTFKSKFLLSLDLGLDTYSDKVDSRTINNNVIQKRTYDANILALRNQISLGYSVDLHENFDLVFKISLGIFSIRNVKIFDASFEQTTFQDNTLQGEPINYLIEYRDKTDYEEVYGYGTNYFSGFNLFLSSLELRYSPNNWSYNLFLGYTPLQKQVIQRFNNNNLFIVGFRLGYTLPFSRKKNE
jgi:hypothetical protein